MKCIFLNCHPFRNISFFFEIPGNKKLLQPNLFCFPPCKAEWVPICLIGLSQNAIGMFFAQSQVCALFYPFQQEYSIDITFCQTWYDDRLRHNGIFDSFVLSDDMVSQLWIPDTFFRNSKRTQVYALTMPNQMVRIHKDGKVLYTVRYVKPLESYFLGLFLPF